MPLINYEINHYLTLAIFVIYKEDRATTFAIADTKCNAPVVTLSTEDSAKLFQQLKSGF